MFFIGIFGTDGKVVPILQVSGNCTACGIQGKLDVFHKYSYFHAFFIPVFRFHNEYFAVCNQCGSVYEISTDAVKRMQTSGDLALKPQELHLTQNNNRPRCRNCGAVTADNFAYCPHCGSSK